MKTIIITPTRLLLLVTWPRPPLGPTTTPTTDPTLLLQPAAPAWRSLLPY
jgi:hypothetical protein